MSFVACTIVLGDFTLVEVLMAVLNTLASAAEVISSSKDSIASDISGFIDIKV